MLLPALLSARAVRGGLAARRLRGSKRRIDSAGELWQLARRLWEREAGREDGAQLLGARAWRCRGRGWRGTDRREQ